MAMAGDEINVACRRLFAPYRAARFQSVMNDSHRVCRSGQLRMLMLQQAQLLASCVIL